MKDFNKFIKYFEQNIGSVISDISNTKSDFPIEQSSITPEEWALITKIAVKTSYSILRLYHNWMNEN